LDRPQQLACNCIDLLQFRNARRSQIIFVEIAVPLLDPPGGEAVRLDASFPTVTIELELVPAGGRRDA
jgi:hypothetical protein